MIAPRRQEQDMISATPTSWIHHGFAAQAAFLDDARALIATVGFTPRILIVAFDLGVTYHLVSLHVRALESVGATVEAKVLGLDTRQADLEGIIDGANADEAIDGVLILTPVPSGIDFCAALNRITPAKELEGVHPAHAVRMLATTAHLDGLPARRPVVVDAALALFADAGVSFEVADLSVAIVSDVEIIDTNPLANLMVRAAAPALFPPAAALSLVTLANAKAKDILQRSDIVVVSLLRPRFLDRTWFKEGAIVLDFAPSVVGVTRRADGRQVPEFCGGVDIASVEGSISKLFPVPSGIGPVMLGVLARNLARSAVHRRSTARRAAAPSSRRCGA